MFHTGLRSLTKVGISPTSHSRWADMQFVCYISAGCCKKPSGKSFSWSQTRFGDVPRALCSLARVAARYAFVSGVRCTVEMRGRSGPILMVNYYIQYTSISPLLRLSFGVSSGVATTTTVRPRRVPSRLTRVSIWHGPWSSCTVWPTRTPPDHHTQYASTAHYSSYGGFTAFKTKNYD